MRVCRPECITAALLGLLGLLLPGGGVFAGLAWMALAAPAAGHLAAAGGGRRACLAVLPLVWLAVLALGSWTAGPAFSAWTAPALCGLYLLGVASGRSAGGTWLGAGLWLALAFVLGGAATGWGVLAEPWPPAVAARLIDVSPVSLVLESAGVDWMRHPALYEAAGTLDIGPELRHAWRGQLAGPVLFVLGCFALAASNFFARRPAAPRPAALREYE